jgi:hypothetical protein
LMSSRRWIRTTGRAAILPRFKGECPRLSSILETLDTRLLHVAGVFVLLVVFFPASRAQSLRVSSVAARPGDTVAIEIRLLSPDGQAPQILQWKTTIPRMVLAFADSPLQAGPAAEASDKSVTCAGKTGSPETHTLTCILAGGLKAIPNGVIAVLRLHIRPDATPGKEKVSIAGGVAVLQGLKEVPLSPAEGIVTVVLPRLKSKK